jgi:hypothetical protein
VTQKSKFRRWQREIYLLSGVVLGIFVMVLPALLFTQFNVIPPVDPIEQTFWDRPQAAMPIITPFDALFELLWLALPALIVILCVYWLFIRRKRWAGYDEAVKWLRR